ISLSSSTHFAPMLYSNEVNPVALPPGRAKLSTKPAPTGSGHDRENDWHAAGGLQQGPHRCAARGKDDLGRERDQFGCVFARGLVIAARPAVLDLHVLPDGPA